MFTISHCVLHGPVVETEEKCCQVATSLGACGLSLEHSTEVVPAADLVAERTSKVVVEAELRRYKDELVSTRLARVDGELRVDTLVAERQELEDTLGGERKRLADDLVVEQRAKMASERQLTQYKDELVSVRLERADVELRTDTLVAEQQGLEDKLSRERKRLAQMDALARDTIGFLGRLNGSYDDNERRSLLRALRRGLT